jgi:CubicO group peptidase (beta-lactamase class C family)
MKAAGLYRFLVRALPHKRRLLKPVTRSISEHGMKQLEGILYRHRALGGALAYFDEEGIHDHFVYGEARKGLPITAETSFRVASVSKLVTAAGILNMAQRGLLDLDSDADKGLPYSLRHPDAPEMPVTLRMLMTHTAGIRDGKTYLQNLFKGTDAASLLKGDSHTRHLPGKSCEYSNFGVGLAACAIEAQTGLSFETAMQEYLFAPLVMKASFYPQRIKVPLADARRVLTLRENPNFDAAGRQAQPLIRPDVTDMQHHYTLAQGNCCLDVQSLARLSIALIKPGFLNRETLDGMRRVHAELGRRDPTLGQGIGIFILNDAAVSPCPLYGHQGMAYGAVHMLFLDLERKQGIISLTTGVSEARTYILADVNKALLSQWRLDD